MRKTSPKSYDYIEKLLPSESNSMRQAREHSVEIGLDTISISATEARLIQFHLKSIKAEKVLEIGTLTGLSALHILQVLPSDGLLVTVEKSEQHAALAEKVLAQEIAMGRCRILKGDAQEKLQELNHEIFDAVFIDGNKAAYLDYFNWAIDHLRVGGLVIADNIFLAGAVWGDETKQKFNAKQIAVVQQMNTKAFSDSKLRSVILPTEEGLLITQKVL
jgi:predicted O-methyltransferase YrrM